MESPQLANALLHEFQRCRDAFNFYVALQSKIVAKNNDKKIAISCYNAYMDFVSHLYEFYLGNITKRENCRNAKGKEVDKIINNEVEKLLIKKIEGIKRGEAHQYENDISYYDVTVPEEFGREFRAVRNMRSHAGHERSEYDLASFFIKYHRFVYILFEYPHWLWSAEEFPDHDWLAIERFANAIAAKDT